MPADVRAVAELVEHYSSRRILIAKDLVAFFEAVQEFVVAEFMPDGDDSAARIIGCGALHIMWDDLGEVRTLAVDPEFLRLGIGSALIRELIERARGYRLSRLFSLTFEVDFFQRHGFEVIEGTPVAPEIYQELLRSSDDGVAEFLDLARVKPNTLGNTRVLLALS
jgi:amino-acid N-acetyltransferase